MARLINRLSPNAVRTIKGLGRHADGGGLFLSISPNGGRRWTFIYRWHGKKTEIGFGSLRDVTLARAREMASAARVNLASGINPRTQRAAPAVRVPTFGEVADDLIDAMEPSWRNAKHAEQWKMTLRVHAAPLRPLTVNTVTTPHVLDALAPLWARAPETASRLRGRIERVMAAAKAKGYYSGENPARWRDNLKELLPVRTRASRGHFAAMAYAAVPAFMKDLRAIDAMARLALDLTILTAARTSETLAMRWPELELAAQPVTVRGMPVVTGPCWTVPAERMKGGRIHQVPLSSAAVAILERLRKAKRGQYVFPGRDPRRPLSNMAMEMVLRRMKITDATVHGFRSSFRDWASETTAFPGEVVEMALAHVITNKTEAAYRRGGLFEKRKTLMEEWAAFLRVNR